MEVAHAILLTGPGKTDTGTQGEEFRGSRKIEPNSRKIARPTCRSRGNSKCFHHTLREEIYPTNSATMWVVWDKRGFIGRNIDLGSCQNSKGKLVTLENEQGDLDMMG